MENLNDVALFREKSRFFLGRAKIQLANLNFDRNIQLHEKVHVDKLVDVFRGEGCHRLDPWNHVPVAIDRNTLSARLRLAGLDNDDLIREGEPPLLRFTTPLRVLHGRRRLLAAEEYLWDKWWIAELYSDGDYQTTYIIVLNINLYEDLPAKLKTSICEQYSHSRPFCDGDIYRHIFKYQRDGNIDEEEKWIRRLSNSKTMNVRQLRTKYRRLANGFDRLTPFVGIWYQLHLGCLSRLLPDKTPEEFLHYLERMRHQYSSIMGTEEPFLLDPKTVYLLETMFPALSVSDADHIKRLMNDGVLFPAVQSQHRRKKLLDNILGVKGRILSFYTFFQDTIYFGACSKILRNLLPPKFQGTVRQAFFNSYQQGINQGRIRLQSYGERMLDRPGTEVTHVQLAYRQLYLAAMRDFPILSSLAPLWDSKKRRPLIQGSPSERWHQIASLAFVLGFRTDEIAKLMEDGNNKEIMAREFLTKIRPAELYIVDEGRKERLVQYIARQIDGIATPRVLRQDAEFTTNVEGLAKEQRCNRPYDSAYRRDKDFLFINIIYGTRIRAQAFITSLAIQRDIFICFLGMYPIEDMADADSEDEVVDLTRSSPSRSLSDNDLEHEMIAIPSADSNEGSASEEATGPGVPGGSAVVADSGEDNSEEGGGSWQTAESEVDSGEADFILHLWDKNEGEKYRNTEAQRRIFENTVCDLADKGYRFLCIDKTGQAVTQSLHKLWEKALDTKLILACPKVDSGNPAERVRDIQGYQKIPQIRALGSSHKVHIFENHGARVFLEITRLNDLLNHPSN
ncbi:conserved hypothetical protein [Talaromyces stipitatus ATCC 10500]|uniref:Uncharacterized protein n=1 Tax=Talaromyces stipitatus (strain ATCC 10500 / CBS 375.48 / QM 6759 / NRRL 1006) TaxID=441959 RepID=B8M0B1_TALSN|nr:uncharacterized protein TSTA_084390 [Talaromyces stipitatus ATCC 10500]EED21208.1 conserved hypothetical protein [Talaromyces stipitatus ATCC 10500]